MKQTKQVELPEEIKKEFYRKYTLVGKEGRFWTATPENVVSFVAQEISLAYQSGVKAERERTIKKLNGMIEEVKANNWQLVREAQDSIGIWVLEDYIKELSQSTNKMNTMTEELKNTLPENLNGLKNDPIKLLLEKFGTATTRFVKGKITRERRESIYDEVYLAIRDLLTSSQKDKEKAVESKINMILLGIATFFESEKARDEEEKRGLIRKDGGRTMSAFSLIHQLKIELESLKSKKEQI